MYVWTAVRTFYSSVYSVQVVYMQSSFGAKGGVVMDIDCVVKLVSSPYYQEEGSLE